jgi:tetratricopeptide (TPR) repeat protein
LPVWQALYEELHDNNFEIVSVAQDSKGVEATREWITATPLTYTALVDEAHLVSKLYNMVNVPTGVWIDESGTIVRPNEVAFADNRHQEFTGQDAMPYIDAVRDWVKNGKNSPYIMSEALLGEKLSASDPDALLASAEFGLAEQLQRNGYAAEAIAHFKEAQRLNPKSWNYKRQAYALGNAERDYDTTFMTEVKKIGGPKKYYPPPLAEI